MVPIVGSTPPGPGALVVVVVSPPVGPGPEVVPGWGPSPSHDTERVASS